jgi:hypothetical protein
LQRRQGLDYDLGLATVQGKTHNLGCHLSPS